MTSGYIYQQELGLNLKDPDTESLIRRFLQGGVLIEGSFEETRKGTAQGSLCRAPHKDPYVE